MKNSFDKRYTAPDVKKELQKKKNTILCGGWHLNCFSWCFLLHKKNAQKKIEEAGIDDSAIMLRMSFVV